jgi:hypothetical protein
MVVRVLIGNNITGATTLNCNGLGNKTCLYGGAPLTIGLLNQGNIGEFIYDGTNFQLIGGVQPKTLSANHTLYVNGSTGSDTLYDGSAATVSGAHGPFATIQKAFNVASTFAPGPYTITINIAAGTYAAGATTQPWAQPNLVINGAGQGSTIIETVNSYPIGIIGPITVTVQNLTAACSYSGSGPIFSWAGVFASNGANVTVENVTFGACYYSALLATYGAAIAAGPITIDGNMQSVLAAVSGGTIQWITGTDCTIEGAVTLSGQFAYAAFGSTLSGVGATFVNPSNVTGPCYLVAANAVIYTNGGGGNFFPGSTSGSTSGGGEYI